MYWFEWFRSLGTCQREPLRGPASILLRRVCDQRQDLLVLVQQQHGPQVAESLVRKARRGQQLQAFNLPEMRALAQREQIQQLGDIISPVRL